MNTPDPSTRKQTFLNYLMKASEETPGRRFTLKSIAVDLDVEITHFSTDIRKWMDTVEFGFVHRGGSGGAGDPHLYWYDSSFEHQPLPERTHRSPRSDKGKRRTRAKVDLTPAVPERNLPGFVRPAGRGRAIPGETVAMIIFREGDRVILLDDQDHLIRGRFVD